MIAKCEATVTLSFYMTFTGQGHDLICDLMERFQLPALSCCVDLMQCRGLKLEKLHEL